MKNKARALDAIEQELYRGMHRESYVIYCRKSTDEPDNQKNSLSYQRESALAFARRERLVIAPITTEGFSKDGVVSEKHSAFKDSEAMVINDDGTAQFSVERPKFHRLVQYLNKRQLKGVIFLCWDRASRNPGDSTILKKLKKKGVDLRFVLATYDKSSSGELHMDIDDMFAEHHSRVTSEKVKLAIERSKRNGLCTYQAPAGYLNLGSMEHKPLDPERAPVIVRMFALAEEGWSLADIARSATEQGFTMPPKRRYRTRKELLADEENDNPMDVPKIARPPLYQTIQKILRNRFYTGLVRGEYGAWVESKSHEALISPELFERVQRRLSQRNRSRQYGRPLLHAFRRMVTCASCSRVYTPYIKKDILYLTSRCRDGCNNDRRNVNLAFLSAGIGAAIANLSVSDEDLRELEARALNVNALTHERRLKGEEVERRRKTLHEEVRYLSDNKLALLRAAVYSPEAFKDEERRLEQALVALESEERERGASPEQVLRAAKKLSELLRNVEVYWDSAEPNEKEQISRIVFSELRVSHETLQCKASTAFAPLQNRLVSYCAQERT